MRLHVYNSETMQWDDLLYKTAAIAVETEDGETVQAELDVLDVRINGALERANEAYSLGSVLLSGHKIVNSEGTVLPQRANLLISGDGITTIDNESENATELHVAIQPYIDAAIGNTGDILDKINGVVIE